MCEDDLKPCRFTLVRDARGHHKPQDAKHEGEELRFVKVAHRFSTLEAPAFRPEKMLLAPFFDFGVA